MSKKEEFKLFVKNNPILINHVQKGEMNWQKFYELFDLYGEDKEIWKDYLNITEKKAVAAASAIGIAEFFNFFKQIDLNGVQEGIGSLQRVVGLMQDFTGKTNTTTKEEYKPRPIYKHFED